LWHRRGEWQSIAEEVVEHVQSLEPPGRFLVLVKSPVTNEKKGDTLSPVYVEAAIEEIFQKMTAFTTLMDTASSFSCSSTNILEDRTEGSQVPLQALLSSTSATQSQTSHPIETVVTTTSGSKAHSATATNSAPLQRHNPAAIAEQSTLAHRSTRTFDRTPPQLDEYPRPSLQIGTRISVFHENTYCNATVQGCSIAHSYLEYDEEGKTEWLDLSQHKFKILSVPPSFSVS
jgi:hypothetical protein